MKKNIDFFYFLKEYQRFSFLDIIDDLKKNSKYIKNQIDQLIEEKILVSENTNIYYFKFVGTVNFLDIMIVVFPKYKTIPNKELTTENKNYIRQLFKIFEKYESETKNESNIFIRDYSINNSYFSLFSLYKRLINDFIENGLYENEESTYSISGNGEIDWEKTVLEIYPYFKKDKNPIYMEYFSYNIENEQENYIKLIQEELLGKATKYFNYFKELGLHIVDLDYYFNKEIIGENSYKIYKIDLELRNVFSERKIQLLTLMKEIIENLEHSKNNDINLYGTKNYELVWENICKTVIGHDKQWIEIITKPKWKDFETKKETEVRTLLPDITFFSNKIFNILDAKYYNCTFDDNGKLIGSKPGVGDISKQFLYQSVYEDYFTKHNIEIENYYNAFLMPTESLNGIFKKIGEITFPLTIFQKNGKEKVIDILKLNTQEIYKMYLKNEVNNKLLFYK